jgi:hypothetical protein
MCALNFTTPELILVVAKTNARPALQGWGLQPVLNSHANEIIALRFLMVSVTPGAPTRS